jgi:hypothetical protein
LIDVLRSYTAAEPRDLSPWLFVTNEANERRKNKIFKRIINHTDSKGGIQSEMWIDYLSGIYKECEFKAPASEAEIASIKEDLNVGLPAKLAGLYNETNGVYGSYGTSFIWSTEQMVRENLFFRTLHEYRDLIKPLDTFLFFSDAGNGDLFGYAIEDGMIQSEEIFVWNHEDDGRSVIASSLEEFIKGWIMGEISV